jgi:hypothetical protein
MLAATRQTWLGTGRYATQFAAPLIAGAVLARRGAPAGAHAPGWRLLAPARGRTADRWWRRAAAASLLLGPPLATWLARRPALDPARFAVAQLGDDMAYGAGVWAGAIRARTAAPVRPAIAWRPLRGLAPDPASAATAQSPTTGAED